jgi:hypothetical protein
MHGALKNAAFDCGRWRDLRSGCLWEEERAEALEARLRIDLNTGALPFGFASGQAQIQAQGACHHPLNTLR